MDIYGDPDNSCNALAQLATARYAPESIVPGAPRPFRPGAESLCVLSSLAELRAAVQEIAGSAQRLLSIYTQYLEPELYEQTAFLDLVKKFVLTRSFSKVRVLLADPSRALRDSNRFVAMGKRLSSCIDIRYVAAAVRQPQRASAYVIADDRAIVYRLRSDSWDAVADINNPPVARLYLQEFEVVWTASAVDHGLRRPPRRAKAAAT